ncbi:hypothetical protein ACED30_23545 [Vibrio splendidus]|uniref:hypothetical protein n=1 Tax=Vibrio splendidus TaxID=29497 RepID=UPI00352CEE33
MHVADIKNALVSTSNPTSVDISDYMKKAYPQLKGTEGDLELGAKVLSGEMEWH